MESSTQWGSLSVSKYFNFSLPLEPSCSFHISQNNYVSLSPNFSLCMMVWIILLEFLHGLHLTEGMLQSMTPLTICQLPL